MVGKGKGKRGGNVEGKGERRGRGIRFIIYLEQSFFF